MAIEFKKDPVILVIEKEESALRQITAGLNGEGIHVIQARGEYEALQLLSLRFCDLVIMDEDTALIRPEETIRLLRKERPMIPIILLIDVHAQRLVSGETLKAGIVDYLPKPVDIAILLEKVSNELCIEYIHQEVAALRGRLKSNYGFAEIIGKCVKMEEVFRAMEGIAGSDVTVYIRGESGTGKELVAREIHRKSNRRNKPFIPLNCAAIPESLLESELFGHEKGAFTGAMAQRKGKFEMAHEGTLFLDEIGEMSLSLQAKILRVLEEQEFERVGGSETLRVDVRIITATNKDLPEEVKRERFRRDLFYRINVFPIHLPPLRERKDDIPLLVSNFIDKMAKKNNRSVRSITPAAMQLLIDYEWPGNIRELENVIERAVLLCPGRILERDQFSLGSSEEKPLSIESREPPKEVVKFSFNHSANNDQGDLLPLEEMERQYLEYAMRMSDGNISRAAQQLKIGRSTLYRKLQKYKLLESQ